MNPKFTRIIILMVVVFITFKTFRHFHSDLETTDDTQKVKVSVYYEALCPDSKFFITYQLLPIYENMKNFIILDLIPYGKAQTTEVNGEIIFHCQHDALECFANKIHSCVLEYVKEPLLQIKYIACMITDNMIPEDAGEKCGHELDIDFTPISDCSKGDQGSQLLKMYGQRTNSLNPGVQFIPTIELNGSQTIVPQSAILKDLSKSICQLFKNKPNKCR